METLHARFHRESQRWRRTKALPRQPQMLRLAAAPTPRDLLEGPVLIICCLDYTHKDTGHCAKTEHFFPSL